MVRLAAAHDAEEVTRLLGAFRDHLRRDQPSVERFAASVDLLIGDPTRSTCWRGRRRRASASCATAPASGSAPATARSRISTWPGARGSGFGRALVEAALERARERGCASGARHERDTNTAAVALYESVGFSSGRGRGTCISCGVGYDLAHGDPRRARCGALPARAATGARGASRTMSRRCRSPGCAPLLTYARSTPPTALHARRPRSLSACRARAPSAANRTCESRTEGLRQTLERLARPALAARPREVLVALGDRALTFNAVEPRGL